MSASEWVNKNMNYRAIKKFLLQWLEPGEGAPDFPWEDGDEAAGPLAFGPGLIWADGGIRTIRMTYEPYELAVGDPGAWFFARTLEFQVDTAGPTAVFVHDFHRYPIVQVLVHGTGPAYGVFDLAAVGGSILHTDTDTFVVDFGGAFIGLVLAHG